MGIQKTLAKLQESERGLLLRITRRMINYLCWQGISDAEELLLSLSANALEKPGSRDENVPQARYDFKALASMKDEVFRLACEHLSAGEVENCIESWVREDRTAFLVDVMEKPNNSLEEISAALDRFRQLEFEEDDLPPAMQASLRVALLRRIFSEQLDFINSAKRFARVSDFYELVERMVSPSNSHGKLGGKSAGIFLATNVIRRVEGDHDLLGEIRLPRTWYLSSDGLLDFIRYNNLDDVYSRKYMDIEQIRQDYPHLVQVFKNSYFAPEIIGGLSRALQDLGNNPLIVRSSSLLEDRSGSAFSGKYKSLFLPNQGRWQERLDALIDAIAEVYASIFGPDPIEYRAERNLIDVHEEMGIMIQQVVGQRVGRYFLPSFSGVAFSNNQFRWSPRIRQDDGLVRLVPGLGTRAVDRISDDYPILLAPGQPTLRVNVTPGEIMRYSPSKLDLINLETNSFETMRVADLLAEVGLDYPGVMRMISIVDEDRIARPSPLNVDFESGNAVVTFEGLVTGTRFVKQMRSLLEHLEEETGGPVDVEFASDGESLYLLQCRPQGYSAEEAPSPIPAELPPERVLFSAGRFVSNGRVPPITHIVYVDPGAYDQISDLAELKKVGRAVGRLNKILRRKQFILMGPGRWGSRGDIRLGVDVGYSDINNTSVLIEIARKKGSYVPDLSFGTHFFQDLVEAGIRYLPLYPDDEGILFNEEFFTKSKSILTELLPSCESLSGVLRVIDVADQAEGQVLRLLMNADLDQAVGLLVLPGQDNFFTEDVAG